MTSALEGGEWSASRPGRTLPPRKNRYPFYRRLGGPQGRSRRAENLVPTAIRSRTVQPVVNRYTDWATRPRSIIKERNAIKSCIEDCLWCLCNGSQRRWHLKTNRAPSGEKTPPGALTNGIHPTYNAVRTAKWTSEQSRHKSTLLSSSSSSHNPSKSHPKISMNKFKTKLTNCGRCNGLLYNDNLIVFQFSDDTARWRVSHIVTRIMKIVLLHILYASFFPPVIRTAISANRMTRRKASEQDGCRGSERWEREAWMSPSA